MVLGYGVRPKSTIQKIFPTLESKDYYEIIRMCMDDGMPKNSETQMLSALIKWMKVNLPERKVLFTWADGILGKVGYVYQAANFYYCGYSETDRYSKDSVLMHPRNIRPWFASKDDPRITIRPTKEQLEQYNILHFRGNQYKYIYFLCSKNEQKKLISLSSSEISKQYPKKDDLLWKVYENGKWFITKDIDKYHIGSDVPKEVRINIKNSTGVIG